MSLSVFSRSPRQHAHSGCAHRQIGNQSSFEAYLRCTASPATLSHWQNVQPALCLCSFRSTAHRFTTSAHTRASKTFQPSATFYPTLGGGCEGSMYIVWIWPRFRPGLGLCVVGFLPLSCKRWDFRPFGLGARCSFISFTPTVPRACCDIWPTSSIPSRAQPLWGSVMKHLRSLPLTLLATKELFCARGLR